MQTRGKSPLEIYDAISIQEIQTAADQLRSVYDTTDRRDGYVSLEINPHLANQKDEQIEEGLRLYQAVGRPNVMIKVPATPQGLEVAEALIANGINVNITLIFSLRQYEGTVEAYFKGLEQWLASGGDPARVRSVASFFVSRVDSAVDKRLEELHQSSGDASLKSLFGTAAVAHSHRAYAVGERLFTSQRFQDLQAKGAARQRILWASTSTKNPSYPDIKYVTELIAPDTVNTMPAPTLEAFLDHGIVSGALTPDDSLAADVLDRLAGAGIDMNTVCRNLLDEGIEAFNTSFDELLKSIKTKAVELAV